MKIFILALLHHKYHLLTKLPLKTNLTNSKNVNFVTMQAYSPYYSYEKIINVDKIIYNKLTTLPQCDVYPMLWMFSDIDTVWLDTHENVTKIDQDAAQHPTLSRNIQEHRIWAI